METTIFTFNITIPFEQWAEIFDSEEMNNMHAANGVNPLYRGVSTDEPTKVCVIHQGPVGVATKLFHENKAAIASTGHVIDSTEIKTFKAA